MDVNFIQLIIEVILNVQTILFKRLFFLVTASFYFILPSLSQEKDDEDFEILAHKVYVQILPDRQEFHCLDTVTVHLLKPKLKILQFGMMPFINLAKVKVSGDNADFRQNKDTVTIEDVPKDTLTDIIFDYSAKMNFKTDFTGIGKEHAYLREEEFLPRAKRTFNFLRFNIEVPSDWEAIAAGSLIKEDSLPASKLFVWQCDQKLMNFSWITVGKFLKTVTHAKSTEIVTYLYPEDSAQVTRIVSLVDSVLQFYSKTFTPFRFSRLAIVETANWVAGKAVLAISVPSMIMVKKMAFDTNDEFNKYALVLPHEVAHQWWPATVFIEEKDAALLSEGLCEYSARLYSEYAGHLTDRDSLNSHPLLRSLITRAVNGLDAPLQQLTDMRSMPTHYLKASFVHNMLRRIMGDSAYALLLHEYAVRFNLKYASLDDFKNLAAELSHKNLDWFFNQWVKSKGIPRMKLYGVKSVQQGEKWVTRGHVRIVGYDKFTTFVDISTASPAESLTTRVWLGVDSAGMYHNDVTFEVRSNQKPTIARLDPNGDILKFRKLPPKMGDLRQPNDGVMIVGSKVNADYLLQRARRDSAEMDDAGWGITIKRDNEITLADLQKERVFIYGKAEENTVVADMQAKYPYQLHGDTAVINGEAISDSSLTLIQMIENPYIASGLMCWVAPLSIKAEPELIPYDHSWTLIRKKEEISSGVWEMKDDDVVVEIK